MKFVFIRFYSLKFSFIKTPQTPSGVCRRYLAIGGRFDVVVEDDFADGICLDAAGARVFDACDVAVDGGVDIRIFKSQVGVVAQSAILQYEIFAVAKWLCLTNQAIDEADIFAVPCEVFADDF